MTPRIDGLDRNFLMNAGFNYWQRTLSKLVNNGSVEYVADRWIMGPGIDGTAGSQTTYSRQTDTPDNKVQYSAQAVGSYVPNEEFSFFQRVESIFARLLSNKKTSLAFNYKTDGCDEVRVKILKPTVSDTFSTLTELYNQTLPVLDDNNWNEIKIENLDLGEVNNGLQVQITFISNTTGVVTTKIAKPKLNIGTRAQQFSLAGRDLVEELQLCQRYFEKSYNINTPVGSIANEAYHYSRGDAGSDRFKVQKRTDPVTVIYSPITGAANTARDLSAPAERSLGLNESSQHGIRWFVSSTPTGNAIGLHWAADAEL